MKNQLYSDALISIVSVFNILLCISPVSWADAIEYSPPTAHSFPQAVYWGDTHVHTNLSTDAFSFGNHSIGPEQAYRFALGETVTSQTGVEAQLARPLDFLLIADHAEFMGALPKISSRSAEIINTPLGQRWGNYMEDGTLERIWAEFAALSMDIFNSKDRQPVLTRFLSLDTQGIEELRELKLPHSFKQETWRRVGATADKYNEPGHFTAFIGYEWSSTFGGDNLHRNVIFRDDANTTSKIIPFSAFDSGNPVDLWQFMERYENQTGGRVLAIPHNPNQSSGQMFALTTPDEEPLSRQYAEQRARWEPLVEVTQMKGDSETHPFLSPDDEFSDFERWDVVGLTPYGKQNSMLQFEYVRSVLKNGLKLEQALGSNPFAFGMIGSTDSHNGLATADENNFFSKMTSDEPSTGRAIENSGFGYRRSKYSAAGYAAVWANENTREALFDAMQRRETYATTGPRITLRFFGGWSFDEDDHQRPDFAIHGYRLGVPMGDILPANNTGDDKAPSFLVAALKDPLGANLDRIQVVKGWLDANGNTHERVYNVAASDGRKIRRNKLEFVGNTVNVSQASYLNSIGDTALSVVWRDPDFNAQQSAFYYVRVLEIPTPRWTTIDAKVLGSKLPENTPTTIQERAYTSPIWYQSAGKSRRRLGGESPLR